MPTRGIVMSEKEPAAKLTVGTSPHSHERGTPGERTERKRIRGHHEYAPKETHPPHKKVTPERILAAFNVRAFRREPPGEEQLMLQFIARAIAFNEPVPFIMYWGKGPRAAMAKPDVDCIAFLDAMLDRVRGAYSHSAKLKLLFTDTHALLNGHAADGVHAYFGEVAGYARERGVDACRLGDVLRTAGLAEATADDEMPQELGERLTASARKWYFGDGTVEQGALKYYRANMIERRAVEAVYPHSIMLTFNTSALRALLPANLPVFYMYSMRRGLSVKPWFVTAEPNS
jgi:L-tyrosine isonitrile synthase